MISSRSPRRNSGRVCCNTSRLAAIFRASLPAPGVREFCADVVVQLGLRLLACVTCAFRERSGLWRGENPASFASRGASPAWRGRNFGALARLALPDLWWRSHPRLARACHDGGAQGHAKHIFYEKGVDRTGNACCNTPAHLWPAYLRGCQFWEVRVFLSICPASSARSRISSAPAAVQGALVPHGFPASQSFTR